jgi:nitroreductase
MYNDLSSTAALLATRRSAKARDMIGPGPDDAQLRQILGTAMRVPDHGKLNPWRFVVVPADQRDAFADMLQQAYRAQSPGAGRMELDAMAQFAKQAPTLVAVLSTPVPGSAIPVWEQQLSSGAACMNMLTAAHALGFVGSWLTGWPAYNGDVRNSLGGGEHDRVAGFIFIGTASRDLDERPRPAYEAVVSTWKG